VGAAGGTRSESAGCATASTFDFFACGFNLPRKQPSASAKGRPSADAAMPRGQASVCLPASSLPAHTQGAQLTMHHASQLNRSM
jgi:hypothetical protein